MKVLFLPKWNTANPYQDLLMSGLKDKGLEVAIDDYKDGYFSLFRLAMKHKNTTIVHIHWISPYIERIFWSKSKIKVYFKLFFYFLDFLLLKICKKKIVWTVHNKFSHESEDVNIEQKFRKLLAYLADIILVHSKSAINIVMEAYNLKNNKKILVVPHGHFIDYYPNTINKKTARNMLNINEKDKVFLFFGSIREYKGLERLIQIFKTNGVLKKAKLLIAGKPQTSEIYQDIKKLIGKSQNIIDYLRYVSDEEIQIFMNCADIVILPFEKILMSSTVVLAMSFAKTLIIPRKGELIDIVDPKGTFFYSDNTELEEVIENILQEKIDFNSIGKYNKKTIKIYDWQKITTDLTKIYVTN